MEEVLFPKAVILMSLAGMPLEAVPQQSPVNGTGVCWVTQRQQVHSWWTEPGEQGVLDKDWEARSSPSK